MNNLDTPSVFKGPKCFLENSEEHPIRRVLVIEDDLFLRNVLDTIIYSIDPDIEVLWATDLGEAYSYLRRTRRGGADGVNMILSDIFLSRLECGTQLWEYCQENHPKTPFAFMSGISMDKYLELFNSNGICPPYITKPLLLSDCRILFGELLSNTER